MSVPPVPAPLPFVLSLATSATPPVFSVPPGNRGERSHEFTWNWPLEPRPRIVELFREPPEPWLAGHRGVDLAPGEGSFSILAPTSGVVHFAGPVAGRGVVTIATDDGFLSSFEPAVAAVARGERVLAGDVIGTIDRGALGVSHCSPELYLHWGVRRAGRYIDPLSLVGERQRSVLLPDASAPRAGEVAGG